MTKLYGYTSFKSNNVIITDEKENSDQWSFRMIPSVFSGMWLIS